jgi:hypothetical protein
MINQLPAAGAIVYIIHQNIPSPMIKIGWTQQSPAARLTKLQVGNPFPLIFFHYRTVPTPECAQFIEKKLHRRYADSLIRGEWFRVLPSTALQLTLDDMADDATAYFELFDKAMQHEHTSQFKEWQKSLRASARPVFEILSVGNGHRLVEVSS